MNRTRKHVQRGLALCIPCDAEDLEWIDICFKSIKAQTRAPDMVCFSVSSATPDRLAYFRKKLKEYSIRATIVSTPDKVLPGENRNRAGLAAVKRGATVISFFDFDDIMHPRRIEIVAASFAKYPAMTGLTNGFKEEKKMAHKNLESIDSLHWPAIKGKVYFNTLFSKKEAMKEMDGKPYYHTYVKPEFMEKHPASAFLHRGHISIRASYILDNRYRKNLYIAEDADFLGRMLMQKKVVGYIPEPLSLYLTH